MSIIDEEKQSNAESARLSGRPYKYWGNFLDYDLFTVCNYFALDLSSNATDIVLPLRYEIQKWLGNNLKNKYMWVELFDDNSINTFLSKLASGMRLWDKYDLDRLPHKHEDALDKAIADVGGVDLICPLDPLLTGHRRFIPATSRFNISKPISHNWTKYLFDNDQSLATALAIIGASDIDADVDWGGVGTWNV
jgi:hypothetical protein